MMNKFVALKNPYQEEENWEAKRQGGWETITVYFFIIFDFWIMWIIN